MRRVASGVGWLLFRLLTSFVLIHWFAVWTEARLAAALTQADAHGYDGPVMSTTSVTDTRTHVLVAERDGTGNQRPSTSSIPLSRAAKAAPRGGGRRVQPAQRGWGRRADRSYEQPGAAGG